MELKEKIKKQIDSIPEEYLPQLERYLEILKQRKNRRKHTKTVHLHGKFDNLNVRRLAYD